MKKLAKFLPLFVTPIATLPLIGVVSCSSNSMESKLSNLLSKDDVISVKLNDDVANQTNLSIKDLFTTNQNIIQVVNSDKLNDWNDNLSPEDQDAFYVAPKIKGIVLPSIYKSDKEHLIDYLEIIVEISAGPIQNKEYKKKLDLTQYKNLNREINFTNGNYFDVENPIPANNLWETLRDNLLPFIQDKNINFNGDTSSIESSLNFKFDSQVQISNQSFKTYNSNIYCMYDSFSGSQLNLIIYVNESKLQNKTDVINNTLCIKLIYTVTNGTVDK